MYIGFCQLALSLGGKMRIPLLCWLVAAAFSSTAWGQSPQPSLLERGGYLVNGILACGNCHSPKGPPAGAEVRERFLSGGVIEWDTPAFKVKGPNITPDPETGIGKWTDSQIKTALQTGQHPNGHKLATIMPYAFYRSLTARDLDAIVAYVRSVPPIKNETQPPIYKSSFEEDRVPNADLRFTEADMNDPVKRGFYLASIGHCFECHTPMEKGRRLFENRFGSGGFRFTGPFGESFARNITSHPEKGIGGWTDEEIKRAITKGVSRDGTKLKPPMAYAWYDRMSDSDLSAIVAYLRTVPPKE